MNIQINQLIRSKRRTIALIVERDGTLTVRAPMHASNADIHSFVQEQAQWILRKQEGIKLIPEVRRKGYVDGEKFLYLGSSFDLELVPPQRPLLQFENGFRLSRTGQHRGASLFTRWYKERAFEVISGRVAGYAARYGLTPKQVRVTSARTRWGSCSPNGNLNFSWRLVMAPLEVIDYVVVHELSHLRVSNHSGRFWMVVESMLPDYKQRRKWLREHGETLTL